jgi:trehalose 6-phosphate synthase/phosphatase
MSNNTPSRLSVNGSLPSSATNSHTNSPVVPVRSLTGHNSSTPTFRSLNTDCSPSLKTSPALAATAEGRLIVVANRLPLSMVVRNGKISFNPSSGGLVSALKGVGLDMLWCGWPGNEVSSAEDQQCVVDELSSHQCAPVFLTSRIADLFYNGFCNNILWPLFHYVPLPIEAVQSHDEQFEAYKEANEEFAKVVISLYKPGDTVWIHDYHLMLLPALLRSKVPDMKIGFFFHTPFPSSEIYRMLPSRGQLLTGVSASNLIGFHTSDYGRHFATACSKICGAAISNNGETLKLGNNWSQLGTFPIGIDPTKFVDALKTSTVQNHIQEFSEKFKGRKVILGIDRLDYIKGIAQKLLAYEKFLKTHPEWIGKCVLVQIAVPSRTDVVEYQKLRSNIHEIVSQINGKYGSVHSLPIHYLDQSIPFDQMTALYAIADCMFITSVRDGMNLVAFEYIACQSNRKGVLVLSEFAGAAQSLGPLPGCLVINPHDVNESSSSLFTALTMEDHEKQKLHCNAFQYVLNHSAARWARKFVSVLRAYPIETPRNHPRALFSPSGNSLNTMDHYNYLDQMDGLVTGTIDESSQRELTSLNNRLGGLSLNTNPANHGKHLNGFGHGKAGKSLLHSRTNSADQTNEDQQNKFPQQA